MSLSIDVIMNWRDEGHQDYIRLGILDSEWRELCNLALDNLSANHIDRLNMKNWTEEERGKFLKSIPKWR